MADYDEVCVKCFKVLRCIFQRFAFLQRRSFGSEIDDVSGKTLLGEFEADACARGRFDEQVDDRFAAQRRDFLDGAFADGFERFGGVEHCIDLVSRE